MAHLVTGHAGTEHIMPSDDGAFNAGVVGTGKYVLDLGNKFAHEIVSNNLVKIMDGELVNQGRHMNIPVNNYEEVTIENGLQAVKRNDLICMRYTKNADTNIETAELIVVKGTSSTSPSDPVCAEGNILEGALVDDFPLYRVRLDGLNIEGVDCLFETMPSLEVVNAKADANAEAIANIISNSEKVSEATVNSAFGSGNVYYLTIGKLAVVTGNITLSADKPSGSANAMASGMPGARGGVAYVVSNSEKDHPAYINGSGKLISNTTMPSGTAFRFTAAYVTA